MGLELALRPCGSAPVQHQGWKQRPSCSDAEMRNSFRRKRCHSAQMAWAGRTGTTYPAWQALGMGAGPRGDSRPFSGLAWHLPQARDRQPPSSACPVGSSGTGLGWWIARGTLSLQSRTRTSHSGVYIVFLGVQKSPATFQGWAVFMTGRRGQWASFRPLSAWHQASCLPTGFLLPPSL